MRNQKIILFVHTNTWFTEMLRVAEFLLEFSDYEPIVHFAYMYPTIDIDIRKLKTKGIEYSLYENFDADIGFGLRIYVIVCNFIERVLRSRRLISVTKFILPVFVLLNSLSKSLREVSNFKKIISKSGADLVVMAGDLVGYNTPEVVRAAHLVGLKCVVVPSTMSDGTEQAEAYFFDSNFSSEKFTNKLAGWLWPKWKKYHKGKWLVRLPATQIAVRQLLGTDPKFPWVSSSTRADALAVESAAMKEYYLRCGLDPGLCFEVGSLANDRLAKAFNNCSKLKIEVAAELGIDPDQKILLTALPPDSLYMTGGRPECEFSTYLQLTEFWVDVLARVKKFSVIISLHPSVDIEQFRYLEKSNVKLSQRSIVDLIPLCDVFVASVSSTIRWAIACAKPVVNYDVYLYRYIDFNAVRGVVYLDKSEDYLKTILKIDGDSSYLNFLKAEIQTQAAHWGNLDGLEGQRTLNLFNEFIRKKPL